MCSWTRKKKNECREKWSHDFIHAHNVGDILGMWYSRWRQHGSTWPFHSSYCIRGIKTSVSILLTAGKHKWRWSTNRRPRESTMSEIRGGVSGWKDEYRFYMISPWILFLIMIQFKIITINVLQMTYFLMPIWLIIDSAQVPKKLITQNLTDIIIASRTWCNLQIMLHQIN